tara:strand:- start:229 stop:534 length:306 start_codon:yes stop_codon:yes gene_type:complete
MDQIAFFSRTVLKAFAASANIFLVAQSLNMPLSNIERVIKFSPYTVFIFLFVYALSTVDGIIPALMGTVAYVLLEIDSLHKMSRAQDKGYNQVHFLKPRAV